MAAYLAVSTAFGVIAFRNFSAILVIVLQFALALVPALLIFRGAPTTATVERLAPSSLMRAILGGFSLVVLQATALSVGPAYFSNFAYLRLEASAGYHVDSAFHVAIIQNILATGRPSTGQHLQPFLAYHWLSHYVDAGIVRLFALDAWESYALLYYVKATGIVLALMRFVERATRNSSASVFWITLAVTTTAFTAGWYPILSHSQWVPVLLILLVGPWLADVINAPDINTRQLIQLSALVVALTLGKGSIGLALAVMFGASVLVKRRFSPQVVITLAVWGLGLAWWASLSVSRTSGIRENSLPAGLREAIVLALSRLEYSAGLVFSLLGMSILLLLLRGISRRNLHLSLEVGVATAIIGIVSIFMSGSSSDAYYYLLGLCYVALVVVLPTVLDRSVQSDRSSTGLALAGIALALSPWAAGAQLGPYQSFSSITASVVSVNDVTYRWYNETISPEEEQVTLWRLISGRIDRTVVSVRGRSRLEALSEEIDRALAGIGSSRSEAFLFIPSEVFADVVATFPGNREWSSGLLVSATTGMALLHGIPPDAPSSTYGFASYTDAGDEARWRSAGDVTMSDLCSFGKPVVSVQSIEPLQIEAACSDE